MGIWGSSSFVVYIGNISVNPSSVFPFATACTFAANQWANGLPATVTLTNTYGNQTFSVFGGTVDDFDAAGYDTSGFSTITAKTDIVWTYEGDWGYNGTPPYRDGYRMLFANCIILDKGRTEIQYKNTIMHEMGHAIGWYGHSSVSTDVMYGIETTVTSLTTRDQNHISQVY